MKNFIEMMTAIIILILGLTGIFGIALTLYNKTVDPFLQWQAFAYGNNMLNTIISKQYEQTPCLAEKNKDRFISICDYEGIQNEEIERFFPEIGKNKNKDTPFYVSVEVKPYNEIKNQNAALISVTIKNDKVGIMRFSGIKAKGLGNDNQKVYIY